MLATALQTKPKTVLVRNVYYLMSYAFNALDVKSYQKVGAEEFSGMDDLLAEILLMGVESQRRRGFERDYELVEEQGWRIKGRVNIRQTMAFEARGLACASYVYDEYDKDTQLNRILKTSIRALIGSKEVSEVRRRRLRGALAYMQDVQVIDQPNRIRWSGLRYHRNNKTYELLMNVCYMIVQQKLINPRDGEFELAIFDDAQWFSALFEHFLLNYYRRHFPQLEASAKRIRPEASAPSFLPSMLTDVTLSYKGKVHVIDAKCYGRIFTMRYSGKILSADHVRQIYYYASHAGGPENVSAMLIYAGTGEKHVNEIWVDNGYTLGCLTLDLTKRFEDISASLDSVVEGAFGTLEKLRA